MAREVYQFPLGVDDRSLLRWIAEVDGVPDDFAKLMKGMDAVTEWELDAGQLSVLYQFAMKATNSGTHHAIYAESLKRKVRKITAGKPIVKVDPAVKKVVQKSMFD